MTIRDLFHALGQSPAFYAIGDLPLWAAVLALLALSIIAAYLRGLGGALARDMLARRKPRRLLSRRSDRT